MNTDQTDPLDWMLAQPTGEIPESAWLMRQLPGASPWRVERRSRMMALGGLALLFALAGASVPVEMKLVERIFPSRPSFIFMLGIFQTLVFPPIVIYGFVIVASLFRGGSLIKNSLIALLMTTPGWITFLMLLRIIHGDTAFRDLHVPIQVIFSNLVGAALVATMFQIWTRWTLLPLELSEKRIPPTSISSLIELTAIFAVACTAGMSMTIDSTGIMVAMALFAGMGVLSAIAIITSLIGFLGQPASRLAQILTLIISFVTAVTFSAVVIKAESGWAISAMVDVIWISIGSLFGMFLILITQAVCLLWLRACGWRCVRP